MKLRLTRAERKLLSLVAAGLDDDEIASALGQTAEDVLTSVEQLLVKTSAQNRIDLALLGLARSGSRMAASKRQ